MNPLSPNQILRNLENGFFMTHREQEEAAALIRDLQKSNTALHTNIHDYAADIVRLRARGRAALAALQSGTELDVRAAIEILRGI
jgi:uncharacterized protein YlxW (UPF0749 family)